MYTDSYGLITQANGDANDQLAREAMLLTGNGCMAPNPLETSLQPAPGVYARYTGAPTSSTSADQIISALCYWVVTDNAKQISLILFRCLERFGFAQNYRNTLNGSNSLQVPDFMLLRSLPLFARLHPLLYPLTILTDIPLVLAAIAAVGPVWKDGEGFAKRSPDDVDDNVIILTLIACSARMPTPLSWLARKIYAKYRAWNFGCAEHVFYHADGTYADMTANDDYPPVIGALRWYHRGESGGNPEVAEAIIPAVKQYILK